MNSLAQATIAIVDDDLSMLESLADLLQSAGYSSLQFSSAAALLESNSLLSISCLISDIRMTGIDGWRLKALVHERRPQLPVILVTAHDLSECLPRTPSDMDNMHALLHKPFDPQVLLLAIEQALRA